ncbi:MAG: pyridoxal phosphate-dependent aminotransferase [Armatimonadota bacterium]|nr:pyridoxal phosphate-dependent aminotransferase [Armatimonadota bacterium]
MDWETRQDRLRASAASARLSDAARRALLLEYEDEGMPSPVLNAHRMADVGHAMTDVVNLSAGGQIHRQPPDFVVQAVRAAVDEGRFHYPGVRGDTDLRTAIAEKLARDNGIVADPESEILPTIGAQMAIDGAIRLLVDPGDDVLLFDPEYASIEPVVRTYGGNVIPVPMRDEPGGWVFDHEALRRRVTARTTLICVSNGHNPTGYLFTRHDLEAIAALARERDLFVFSDEEYEKLTFDGRPHVSIASLPGMAERTITAFSFSKTYCLSGLRIGYMVGPATIMDHMYNVIRFNAQAVGALGQRAALAVLRGPSDAWLHAAVADLRADRDYAVERLNAMPGVRVHPPVGSYFLFARVEAGGMPSWALAEHLLREARISVVSGHHFGRTGARYLRISGCVGRARLEEGLTRMERALARLSARATTS